MVTIFDVCREAQDVARSLHVTGWLAALNLRFKVTIGPSSHHGLIADNSVVLVIQFTVPDSTTTHPRTLEMYCGLVKDGAPPRSGATMLLVVRPRLDQHPFMELLQNESAARRRQLADAMRANILLVLRHELDESLEWDGEKPWWPDLEHMQGERRPVNTTPIEWVEP